MAPPAVQPRMPAYTAPSQIDYRTDKDVENVPYTLKPDAQLDGVHANGSPKAGWLTTLDGELRDQRVRLSPNGRVYVGDIQRLKLTTLPKHRGQGRGRGSSWWSSGSGATADWSWSKPRLRSPQHPPKRPRSGPTAGHGRDRQVGVYEVESPAAEPCPLPSVPPPSRSPSPSPRRLRSPVPRPSRSPSPIRLRSPQPAPKRPRSGPTAGHGRDRQVGLYEVEPPAAESESWTYESFYYSDYSDDDKARAGQRPQGHKARAVQPPQGHKARTKESQDKRRKGDKARAIQLQPRGTVATCMSRDGPEGNLAVPESPRGPLKGPRGPLKGPRDPLKGPRFSGHGRRWGIVKPRR